MSTVKKWMQKAQCPSCKATGTIRTILYGFPTDEMFQDSEIVLGGCLIGPGPSPKHACKECSWEGTFKNGKLVEQSHESDEFNMPEVIEDED